MAPAHKPGGLAASALLACVLLTACGQHSKDLTAEEVQGKVKVGMTESQVKDQLGEPATSVKSNNEVGVRFLEYETKDKEIVAVTLGHGTVSGVNVIGSSLDSGAPASGNQARQGPGQSTAPSPGTAPSQ